MLLVIVYVGAVAVLFLFVVMMLDIDFAEMRAGFVRYAAIGLALAVALAAEIIIAIGAWSAGGLKLDQRIAPIARRRCPISRRSGSCSTRAICSCSKARGWCCWSR